MQTFMNLNPFSSHRVRAPSSSGAGSLTTPVPTVSVLPQHVSGTNSAYEPSTVSTRSTVSSPYRPLSRAPSVVKGAEATVDRHVKRRKPVRKLDKLILGITSSGSSESSSATSSVSSSNSGSISSWTSISSTAFSHLKRPTRPNREFGMLEYSDPTSDGAGAPLSRTHSAEPWGRKESRLERFATDLDEVKSNGRRTTTNLAQRGSISSSSDNHASASLTADRLNRPRGPRRPHTTLSLSSLKFHSCSGSHVPPATTECVDTGISPGTSQSLDYELRSPVSPASPCGGTIRGPRAPSASKPNARRVLPRSQSAEDAHSLAVLAATSRPLSRTATSPIGILTSRKEASSIPSRQLPIPPIPSPTLLSPLSITPTSPKAPPSPTATVCSMVPPIGGMPFTEREEWARRSAKIAKLNKQFGERVPAELIFIKTLDGIDERHGRERVRTPRAGADPVDPNSPRTLSRTPSEGSASSSSDPLPDPPSTMTKESDFEVVYAVVEKWGEPGSPSPTATTPHIIPASLGRHGTKKLNRPRSATEPDPHGRAQPKKSNLRLARPFTADSAGPPASSKRNAATTAWAAKALSRGDGAVNPARTGVGKSSTFALAVPNTNEKGNGKNLPSVPAPPSPVIPFPQTSPDSSLDPSSTSPARLSSVPHGIPIPPVPASHGQPYYSKSGSRRNTLRRPFANVIPTLSPNLTPLPSSPSSIVLPIFRVDTGLSDEGEIEVKCQHDVKNRRWTEKDYIGVVSKLRALRAE